LTRIAMFCPDRFEMNPLRSAWRLAPIRGPGRLVELRLRRAASSRRLTAPVGTLEALISAENPPECLLWTWGNYEDDVWTMLGAMLQPGQCAVDVGANCGVLTLLMRACVGHRGRVVAVDPSPLACRRVGEQIAHNALANVRVVNCALGEKPDDAVYVAGKVGTGVLPRVDADLSTGLEVAVIVRTLDQVLRSERVERVDMIKIDTDGAEAAVLRGSHETLVRDRPSIIAEVYSEGLKRRGESAGRVAGLLEAADYELHIPELESPRRWRARPPRMRGLHRTSAAALTAEPPYAANLLAVHRDRDDHREALRRSGLTTGSCGHHQSSSLWA
jgi:FkbM family methyltransferase